MLSRNSIMRFTKPNILFISCNSYFSTFGNSMIKDYASNRDHIITGYFNDGSARFVFSDISNIISNCRQRFDLYEYDKLKYLSIAFNTTILMNTFLSGEERVKLTSQLSENIDEEKKEFFLTIISKFSIKLIEFHLIPNFLSSVFSTKGPLNYLLYQRCIRQTDYI